MARKTKKDLVKNLISPEQQERIREYGINAPTPAVEKQLQEKAKKELPIIPDEVLEQYKPKAKRLVNVRLRNPLGYSGQERMCYSEKKRIIVRAGRRGGKTTGMAIKAVMAFLGDPSKGVGPKR